MLNPSEMEPDRTSGDATPIEPVTSPDATSKIDQAAPGLPAGRQESDNGNAINVVATVITSTYLITHSNSATAIAGFAAVAIAVLGIRRD